MIQWPKRDAATSVLDGRSPVAHERLDTWMSRLVLTGSLLLGIAAAVYYARLGLTLSHYDARAHLVVARRIFDNLTPCWEQIGAVWLPLPHLLNMLPVQLDAWYRSGASAVAISIVSFAATCSGVFWLAERIGGSREAAIAGAALAALNPNLLYLQATPMTEPLLLGLVMVGLGFLVEYLSVLTPTLDARQTRLARAAGLCLAGACLTRYEAWLITSAAIAIAAFVLLRSGNIPRRSAELLSPIALYPVAAIAAFVIHSRLTIGEWFVTGGFYVTDNSAAGNALRSAVIVGWGTRVLTGDLAVIVAGLGLIVTIVRLRSAERAPHALVFALIASALLPWYAFHQGHPFRIRYMVPFIPAAALYAAIAISALPRRRGWAAGALVTVALLQRPPFWSEAAMVLEAQWDREPSARRRVVSDYLGREYDGQLIMASMGSLAHYMQDLSRVPKPGRTGGFVIGDFLHEGTGEIWIAALDDPSPHVGWILIEERAEGGDMLAFRSRDHPSFLRGFIRVAEGGGVALYRRRG